MRDVRKSSEYQRWRQEVRKRDGNACRVCGVQRNLHIHHIKPLEKYPEFATELDNGITLCGNCHTFLNGKEESINLQTIVEAVTGQHHAQTADQLKRLNGKLCVYLETQLKSSDRSTMNHAVYQLFVQLQTYPDSLDQFLPLIERILNETNGAQDQLSKQMAVESLRSNSSKSAARVLRAYEKRREAEALARRTEERRRSTYKMPIVTLSGLTVLSVAYSPDGETIALGYNGGKIKLWRENITTLEGHTGDVLSLAFSPDGETLASGAQDGTIKLWTVKTGENDCTIKVPYEDIYEEGISADDVSVRVTSLAYSPAGGTLASGASDGTVKLWTATGRFITAFKYDDVSWDMSVAYSPDGETLVSGSSDGTVKLWNDDDDEEITTIFASINRKNGDMHRRLAIAFSPDGETLAIGSDVSTVELWDVATEKKVTILEGHTSRINAIAYSPCGEILASGSGDGTVRLWTIADGGNIATIERHTGWVNCLAYSPDGETLVSGYSDGSVALWPVRIGENISTFVGHADWVTSVDYSPDGKTLASGSWDNTVKLWDVATGENVATFTGHSESVQSIAYSPCGKTLASGSRDGTVKLWEGNDEGRHCHAYRA